MNFINKLERKYGKYGIRNLTLYIICAYGVGYILEFLAYSGGANFLQYLTLEPAAILHGQVWRIITWVLVPPSNFDIFTLIMLLLYYQLGTALERSWGTFRYNLYIFSGILFTVIGAMVLYGVLCVVYGTALTSAISLGYSFSTYYINLSIFLAFAACYPDLKLMLYFLIPIKIKWLAWLDVIVLLYSFVKSGWAGKVAILVSLLNFILFFFGTRNYKTVSPKEMKRKQNYKKQVNAAHQQGYRSADGTITKHKCAICGRTELDGDDLEFRFCSKCDGNYEYCQDHLFTHQHIKK